MKAKIVRLTPWHQSPIIGAHADHVSPFTPRQQSRYAGDLVRSAPPFKPSRVRNLIGAIISVVAA